MEREDAEDELWRAGGQEGRDTRGESSGLRAIDPVREQEQPPPTVSQQIGRERTSNPTLPSVPSGIDFEDVGRFARQVQNDQEARVAREQLKQPELSPDMAEWMHEQDRDTDEDVRPRGGFWHFVPERRVILSILRDEQGYRNKVKTQIFASKPKATWVTCW